MGLRLTEIRPSAEARKRKRKRPAGCQRDEDGPTPTPTPMRREIEASWDQRRRKMRKSGDPRRDSIRWLRELDSRDHRSEVAAP
jgi:hypothetical protein